MSSRLIDLTYQRVYLVKVCEDSIKQFAFQDKGFIEPTWKLAITGQPVIVIVIFTSNSCLTHEVHSLPKDPKVSPLHKFNMVSRISLSKSGLGAADAFCVP